MILCLDMGNTHLYGGVYDNNVLKLQFRYPSNTASTSDQLGIFFKSVLRENGIVWTDIKKVAICSVVPSLNYSVRAAFFKYFSITPYFLQADNNITINLRHMQDLGADRIACAVAAIAAYPNQPLIVIDLGTAITIDAIAANHDYLGGLILPGLAIAMKGLSENTAKLPAVNIVKSQQILGETTTTQIQSGLYYGHLGALREILSQIKATIFPQETPVIVGTGGFSQLFERAGLFTSIIPELVLDGLRQMAETRILS